MVGPRPLVRIGWWPIVVAWAAAGALVARQGGGEASVLMSGWLALGWPAWVAGRSGATSAAWRALVQGFGAALVVVGLGAIVWPGSGLGLAALLLLLALPIWLGSGLGRLAAVLAANRTSPTPQPTGPIWLSILLPAALIVGVVSAYLRLAPFSD